MDQVAPIALERVNVPKAGDVLASRLRSRIRSGELREGQALPTERELVGQTGLSRTSVREALRILEVEGLIEIRPGRNGGSRVRRPAGDEFTRHLELFIWGRNIGVEDLHDVREALEAIGAEGAARRRTDVDLADLVRKTEAVEANVAAGNLEEYLEANVAWHMAVVRASHNELLISIMNVLSNAIHRATAIEVFDSPDVREATIKIHRAVLSAIELRDAPAARRRMARHVAGARHVALNWRPGEPMKAGRAAPAVIPVPLGETGAGAHTGSDTKPGAAVHTGVDAKAVTGAKAGTGTRAGTGSRAGTDTKAGAGAKGGTGTKTAAGAKARTRRKAGKTVATNTGRSAGVQSRTRSTARGAAKAPAGTRRKSARTEVR